MLSGVRMTPPPHHWPPAETAACAAASERVHANAAFVAAQEAQQGDTPLAGKGQGLVGDHPNPLLNCWRQLDNVFEPEPCFETLIDHPSVIEKV